MASNVPRPTLTATGYQSPTELEILAGVQADMNAAFVTTLNFGTVTNPTPQGQLAASWAAIIGACYDSFCLLANSNDPAYAFGRYQDAIARIYFLQRDPGESTVADCVCVGLAGTVIPFGTLAQTREGVKYFATTTSTIPASGRVTIPFAGQTTGPVPCPADTVNVIFQNIPGWDSINNPEAGVLGSDPETRAKFEERREESVALNSRNTDQAAHGSVNDVAGVLDAYVIDNYNSYDVAVTPEAVIEGDITGTTLTVNEVRSGTIKVGQTITGSNNTGISVESGTTIVSETTPNEEYEVSVSQTVAVTTLNLGGVVLGANCLYAAVVGGDADDIAQALWSKKSPGCAWFDGNTTATVYDDSEPYPPPGIAYEVKWETPSALPFAFKVTLVDNPAIPANAETLIDGALIDAFAGNIDGIPRARIGFKVLSSQYIPAITALGTWAQVASLLMGTKNSAEAEATAAFGASFTGSASGTTLTASSVIGFISVGDTIVGSGMPAGTTIVAYGSGTGGAGTYTLSQAATSSSASLTAQSNVMVVSAVASGVLAVDQYVFDAAANVAEGTRIVSQVSGTPGGAGHYVTTQTQRLASQAVLLVVPNLAVVQVRIDQVPTTDDNLIQVEIV